MQSLDKFSPYFAPVLVVVLHFTHTRTPALLNEHTYGQPLGELSDQSGRRRKRVSVPSRQLELMARRTTLASRVASANWHVRLSTTFAFTSRLQSLPS